jgi:hypothetical protein
LANEDGAWLQEPTDEFAENFGKPLAKEPSPWR